MYRLAVVLLCLSAVSVSIGVQVRRIRSLTTLQAQLGEAETRLSTLQAERDKAVITYEDAKRLYDTALADYVEENSKFGTPEFKPGAKNAAKDALTKVEKPFHDALFAEGRATDAYRGQVDKVEGLKREINRQRTSEAA